MNDYVNVTTLISQSINLDMLSELHTFLHRMDFLSTLRNAFPLCQEDVEFINLLNNVYGLCQRSPYVAER